MGQQHSDSSYSVSAGRRELTPESHERSNWGPEQRRQEHVLAKHNTLMKFLKESHRKAL